MLKTSPSRADVKDKAGDVKDSLGELAATAAGAIASAASDALDTAKDKAATAKEAAAPQVDKVKGAAVQAKEAAAPHVERAKDAAAPHVERAKDAAASVNDATGSQQQKVAEFAGMTKDQAQSLFSDEWMPRIQQAISAAGAAAAGAGAAAYEKLPEQAQHAVERVAPQAVPKKKKKGKLLIAVGLISLAGAGYLIYSAKQKQKAAERPAPVVEPVVPAAPATPAAPVSETDGVGRHSATE